MLVGLHISAWSGRLYDREASDHVAVHHDASTSAGRYNKRLLPKSALAAINAVMSEARTRHYANTLPWDDKGSRLLTVANYERYTEIMDGLREGLVRQRARFIEDYDHYVEQAPGSTWANSSASRTIPRRTSFETGSPSATASRPCRTPTTSSPALPRTTPSG